MNGYNDIIAEPADEEDLAMAYGFEVISQDELYDMLGMSYHRKPDPSSSSLLRRDNGKLPSKPSTSSFVSATSSGVSSMMTKPMSSCSLSSQGTETYDSDDYSSAESGCIPEPTCRRTVEDEYQMSVEKLWYMIQQKRHHHSHEEEMRVARHRFLTMEPASNSHHNRLTEWFTNLIHFPEKIRQIAADKHRFNINKIPQEIRDELKHIYVY